MTLSPASECCSGRRKGFNSETHVKRGLRIIHAGKERVEKLGRADPSPCGPGGSFQALSPENRSP